MFVLMICGAVHWFMDSWIASPSPTELLRRETEGLLQAARFQPDGTKPSTYSANAPIELTICGRFLPEAMRKNGNNYSITIVGVWGDGGTPIPGGTGAIEALVNVLFPDGTGIEMHYYQYTLEVCREIRWTAI
jgi:hypothetical protein